MTKRRITGDLTTGERRVMALIGRGLSNKDVAQKLSLSPQTVSSHLYAIYRKMGVTNRTDAAMQIIGVET